FAAWIIGTIAKAGPAAISAMMITTTMISTSVMPARRRRWRARSRILRSWLCVIIVLSARPSKKGSSKESLNVVVFQVGAAGPRRDHVRAVRVVAPGAAHEERAPPAVHRHVSQVAAPAARWVRELVQRVRAAPQVRAKRRDGALDLRDARARVANAPRVLGGAADEEEHADRDAEDEQHFPA